MPGPPLGCWTRSNPPAPHPKGMKASPKQPASPIVDAYFAIFRIMLGMLRPYPLVGEDTLGSPEWGIFADGRIPGDPAHPEPLGGATLRSPEWATLAGGRTPGSPEHRAPFGEATLGSPE